MRKRVTPSPTASTVPDDLVSGHDRQDRQRQLALDDVQIGVADRAHPHRTRARRTSGGAEREIAQRERLASAGCGRVSTIARMGRPYHPGRARRVWKDEWRWAVHRARDRLGRCLALVAARSRRARTRRGG
jgi:hypothetical protein